MADGKFTKHDRAELAGHLVGMFVEALAELEQHGGSWRDLAFANLIALKAIGQMQEGDEQKTVAALNDIIGQAMVTDVVGKRFGSEDEMKAWLAEQGRNPDGSPQEPTGPVH